MKEPRCPSCQRYFFPWTAIGKAVACALVFLLCSAIAGFLAFLIAGLVTWQGHGTLGETPTWIWVVAGAASLLTFGAMCYAQGRDDGSER